MTGFLSVKMKRKDLEDVYDEFSDFSLSSPARKIRRLDAELPPIMEEEEPVIPLTCVEAAPMEGAVPCSSQFNEERALVLYKPVNTPMLQSSTSSNLSFKVNTHLIPGFKNHLLWSGGYASVVAEAKEIEESMDNKAAAGNGCLAVVPWVPSQHQVGTLQVGDPTVGIGLSEEPMEEEAADDVSSMEVEVGENALIIDGQGARESAGIAGSEGLQQWQQQQQHCMTPQLPQNTPTPIMWSW